jgi:chaperonin cofactor prefoldin
VVGVTELGVGRLISGRPFQSDLKVMANRLQDVQDASMEVELLDEGDAASIPIQLGSIFIHNDQVSLPQ